MRIQEVVLERDAKCRYPYVMDHPMKTGEKAIKFETYVAGKHITIFLCKKHAFELYQSLGNIFYATNLFASKIERVIGWDESPGSK